MFQKKNTVIFLIGWRSGKTNVAPKPENSKPENFAKFENINIVRNV